MDENQTRLYLGLNSMDVGAYRIIKPGRRWRWACVVAQGQVHFGSTLTEWGAVRQAERAPRQYREELARAMLREARTAAAKRREDARPSNWLDDPIFQQHEEDTW